MGRKDNTWSGRPWQTTVAEIFLLFILINYFAKICVLSMGMVSEGSWTVFSGNLLMFLVEILMLFVTADAMLGVASRRPKGWKKAMRGCMLLSLFTVLGWMSLSNGIVITTSSLVTFDPVIVLPVVLTIYLLMLFPNVRRYYTPPMETDRPLWAWIKYSFVSDLFPNERYRISYRG